MILALCDEPEVLEVLRLVKIMINIIRVAVPIILIFTMSITLLQAVSGGNDDDLAGARKKFVVRAAATALIFFIPSLFGIVLNIAGSNDEDDINTCFESATPVGISIAWESKAEKYLENLRNTLLQNDYDNARLVIAKLPDGAKKTEYQAELNRLKEYVDIMNEMINLTGKMNYKRFKELRDKIEAVTDERSKAILQAKFEEIKELLFAFIGDYPIVPFGEDELYTGLKTLKGESLDSLLKRNGSSAKELDEKIQLAVEYYGVGTRKAAVAAAITLIGSVAETGYQLPYFWGGKWAKLGVNPNWATPKLATSCNLYYYPTQAEVDACIKRNPYWAMDCSGFVNWSVIQAVQEVRSQSDTNGGKVIKMNSSTADHAVCDIGDALGTEGHIVLVVGLDDENDRYIIAEESMGLELDSIPYDGNYGDGYYCIKVDDYID